MRRRDAEQRASIVERACLALFVCCLLFATGRCLTSCTSAQPKPCAAPLEAQYTAELVEACGDAGSIAACKDAGIFDAVKARHEASQIDSGCRNGK